MTTDRRDRPRRVAAARIATVLIAGALTLTASDSNGGRGVVADGAVSPDGRIEAFLFSFPDGRAFYSIRAHGRPLIDPSPLGFRFRDGPPLVDVFHIDSVEHASVDETWKPVWGATSEIPNRYNEMTVHLRETGGGRAMDVVFRVFDDGVGFRYVLPEQPNLTSVDIISEETGFRLSEDCTAWWIPNDYNSYEHLFRETPLSAIEGANTPVTLETEGGLFVSIHEANLTDYAGMTLVPEEGRENGNALKVELVPWPDGVTRVIGSTPLVTPWRTIQIGERPGDLIESHLILNLNEPCVIEDTSWIRPMKYLGIWWSLHIGKESWHEGPTHGATTANAKRYVDFAAEHGFGGVLIEGWNTGWDRWGAKGAFDYVTPYDDFDLEDVVRYGREKGVAIIGHHETGGDAADYETRVDTAFDLYNRVGIAAVKTGYAGGIYPRGQHHHGQWMVFHYRRILEKAADARIMLDVHEPIKPTGISRTYPNMMTREGVRGMEYNAWSEGNPPEHTTILPFTRMLAGPLDYTPGIFDLTFDEYKPDNRVHTTIAKQLALYVVLLSPLQMAADLPENYEGHPALGFIERVPCTWDETRVLDAAIGDYVVIARRNGDEWFLGSITDEEGRALQVSLDFLAAGRRYQARIYRDGAGAHWETNPISVDVSTVEVEAEDTMTLELAPGGGAAVYFAPVNREED
ncbi:glycoside hydrolase family 97 protein [bacterium]|nr:glycoside hydrolase family 97 protein [bacterium]